MAALTLSKWAELDPDLAFAELSAQFAAVSPTGGGATLALTSSQILNSHSSPVQLVAGVAGRAIVVLAAIFDYVHVSANYTSDTVIGVAYGGYVDASFGDSNSFIAGVAYSSLTQTASFQRPNTYPVIAGANLASLQGLPIVIASGAANPTGGDSTLTATVVYTLI